MSPEKTEIMRLVTPKKILNGIKTTQKLRKKVKQSNIFRPISLLVIISVLLEELLLKRLEPIM